MADFPSRFVEIGAARARFGEKADRLGAYLRVGDRLADDAVTDLATLPPERRRHLVDEALTRGIGGVPDAPPGLVALFGELDRVPFWVDRARCDRGGAAFLRSGWFGGMVLALYSLVAGYCSPGGNKPLAFSGRLREHAPRRLAETSRFVQAVSLPGGMLRGGDGFAITVRVRLMHAQVRRMLRASPDWHDEAWGAPINQADMAGTVLLFSLIVLDGLRKLGVPPKRAEGEDLLHLWRYVGWVMGVEHDLLVASEAEAQELWDLLGATQGPPDDDSRALADALIATSGNGAQSAEDRASRLAFGYGMSRYLIGDAYADGLRYPRSPWPRILRAARPAVAGANAAAVRSTLVRRLAERAGSRHWASVVEATLGGIPATFAMPDTLAAR